MFELLTANGCSGTIFPVSRTRVRRRRIALALVLAGVVLVGPVSRAWGRATVTHRTARSTSVQRQSAPNRIRDYVVAPGDTIWAIASRNDPGRDPRPLV